MDFISAFLIYIAKAIVFSSILILPVYFINKSENISVKYKYRILVFLMILGPLLPILPSPMNLFYNQKPSSGLMIPSYAFSFENNFEFHQKHETKPLELETERVPIEEKAVIGRRVVPQVLFILYLIIVAVLFLRFFFSLWEIDQLRKKGELSTDRQLLKTIADHRLLIGRHEKIRVALIPNLNGAMTFGFISPVILLPKDIHLQENSFREILLHELEHIRRGDYLRNIARRLVGITLFPLPIMHYINHCLRSYSEILCDEKALSQGGDKKEYAMTILDTFQVQNANSPALAYGVRGDAKEVGERIRIIMSQGKKRSLLMFVSLLFSLSMILLLTGTLAGCVNSARGVSYISMIELKKPILSEAAQLWDATFDRMSSIEVNRDEIALDVYEKLTPYLKKLRRKDDETSRRSLAYMLLLRSYLTYYLDKLVIEEEVNYTWSFAPVDPYLNEALTIIHKAGDSMDKGNILYYGSSNVRDQETKIILQERASAQYTGAGYEEGIALVNLSLAFNYWSDDLDKVKSLVKGPIAWSEKQKGKETTLSQKAFISSCFAIEKILATGVEKSEEVGSLSYGGYSLDRLSNGNWSYGPFGGGFGASINTGEAYNYNSISFNDLIFTAGQLIIPSIENPLNLSIEARDTDNLKTSVESITLEPFVQTEAGTFKNVVRIKYKNSLIDPNDQDSFGFWMAGTMEVWFAPQVGIIKYTELHDEEYDHSPVTISLVEYHMERPDNSYMPLGEGNRWTYSIEGMDKEKLFWEYEVSYRKDDQLILSEAMIHRL